MLSRNILRFATVNGDEISRGKGKIDTETFIGSRVNFDTSQPDEYDAHKIKKKFGPDDSHLTFIPAVMSVRDLFSHVRWTSST